MSNSTNGVSSRAVLVAVATAFVVGLLASLAVRPTDGGTTTVAYSTAAALLTGYVLFAVSSSLVMFDRRDVTE